LDYRRSGPDAGRDPEPAERLLAKLPAQQRLPFGAPQLVAIPALTQMLGAFFDCKTGAIFAEML